MLNRTSPPTHTYLSVVNRIGWSLVLFFGLFSLSTGIVEGIFSVAPDTIGNRAAYGLLSAVAYVAPFLLTAYFFRSLNRPKKNQWKIPSLRSDRRVRGEGTMTAVFPLLVIAGLGINLVAAYLNAVICSVVGYVIPDELLVYSYYDTPNSVILYMTTAIAPAFAEEFLFRGIVYGALRPFGKRQAVIISALTFAFMHQELAQLFYTFVCGIILALMYEWTGNIWCSIFFHLFNNELAVLSETLLYGSYGESAEIFLLIWDLVVVILAAISVILLVCLARKNRKKRSQAQGLLAATGGIFGKTVSTAEPWDVPVSAQTIRRGLRTGGMLTFIILSLATILLGYIIVISM